MHLVPLLQPTQNRNRVLHRRLVHQHRLEAPLQRRVLLDVLAVFVQRRRANAMQFAAGQHRLEQVARVHRALGLSRAHHRMQLVDEQNDLSRRFLYFLQHRLEPLFKLAAKLRAGNQRAHVERHHDACSSDPPVRRRVRCAAPAPPQSPSFPRPARRSAPDYSSSGARAPGSRGGSPRRARSPDRACPCDASFVRSRPYLSSAS